MSEVKSKIRQAKYRLKHDFLVPENVILAVAIVLCLTWTYKSIESMSRNWELTERLNAEKKSLELLRVEVEAEELTNEYLASAEYQELAARRLAGKQMPGEHMVSLPENSESAKNKHAEVVVASEVHEKNYSNFEKWFMYLFPNR